MGQQVVAWLSGQGPLGVIAIMLILALVYQTKQLANKDAQLDRKDAKLDSREAELVKAHEDRVRDQQAMNQILDRVTNSAKDLAIEASQMVAAQAQVGEQVKAALAAQGKSLEEMTRALDKATQSIAQQQQVMLMLQGRQL
jgi:hypothetical protein